MRREQGGANPAEHLPEFGERGEVNQGTEGPHEPFQPVHRDAPPLQTLGVGAVAAAEDVNVVTASEQMGGEVADVDLCPADRIEAGDEVRDLHGCLQTPSSRPKRCSSAAMSSR